MIDIRTPNNEDEWKSYYKLRYDILRAPLGQPLGSEKNEGDKYAVHFALFNNDVLTGVTRIDGTDEPRVSQFRFVAIDNNQQGQGLGRKMMQFAEDHCRSRGDNKIILQARDVSLDFYKSIGYTLLEKTHLLFGQVQHFLMEKNL
jgi:predicted GNAT family N-acyltransferase